MAVETIVVIVRPALENVPDVRRLAESADGALGRDVDGWIMALLTSEVVTNAVQHGGSADVVVASFTATARGVRVAVHDHSPGSPRLSSPDPLASGGRRGLLLVDRLAATWGVQDDDDGKTVWFELPDRRLVAPGTAPGCARRRSAGSVPRAGGE